ncbi:MAG: bacterioferritin-associated ferredoxin [Phycisphaerales bacterium]
MSVTHCICHNVPFSRVVALRAQGRTFEQIRQETRCCTGCTLCEPYVRLAIETGRETFPILSSGEIEAVLARAAPGPPLAPDTPTA